MSYEIANVYKLVLFVEADPNYEEPVNREMLGIVDTTSNIMIEVYTRGNFPEHWRRYFASLVSRPNRTVTVPQNILDKIK